MESGRTLSHTSIPRLAIGALLIVGTALLALLFVLFGPAAAGAFAVVPLGLCFLWVSLRNPAVGMFGMVVVNYYIMVLSRYAPEFQFGIILDAAIAYNMLILSLYALIHRIEWRRIHTAVTLAVAIWSIYCILELANPESVSSKGWISAIRSLALYFLFAVMLTQLLLDRYKYLRYLLVIWTLLTLTAVAKACIQKFFGFNAAENYWLFALGGSTTHIIYSGVRYFSFYSDAANFGAGMGMAMVVFSIAALYYRNKWMKLYMLGVAAAACYGMLISGTRSALAVPFAGYMVYLVLARNFRIILAGGCLLFAAIIFLSFTNIGQGNAIIRRTRSAFDTKDASLQVRLSNQAKLRVLMADKPFGAGLGHGGAKAKEFAPDAPLSQIPTDSWYVMIWVETGVVGIVLHVGVLLFILGWGSFQVLFRLHNAQLKGFISALIAGIMGIVVMSYGNEVLGQIPTGLMVYMGAGFISLSPLFDRELTEAAVEAHTRRITEQNIATA